MKQQMKPEKNGIIASAFILARQIVQLIKDKRAKKAQEAAKNGK